MTRLTTARLVLRPHAIADEASYRRFWGADVPPIEGVTSLAPLDPEFAFARLLRFLGHWTVFGFGPFAVEERATGRIVGEVGFAHMRRGNGADFDGAPEAMWKIDGALAGKGIATEAVEAAIRWFDDSGISQRTVCMINPLNSPSLAIAARFGFRPFRDTTFRDSPVRLFERIADI
ncbi:MULTISPECIES: GNAT family protein [unclassified Agrobacterium]|uniref:GNAT family N-acetyltransferase n=1 Tax=unclassified Agrobacterium TaxID=2632611 RepID=UPI0024471C22|nr:MULTISPECIES: GNAT family protein [unclassified Agrobacterium]MDH0615825.1 GNAT family N-acetyltransferase [Agrobacterium sp. GD03872]MDH0697822.1 GNAT family N-acetyltransferase [Agrobacterium sp. GD03871]MDH1062645.1 GNAT family N-acetyltransferase [Agrobacterium sp. GD03992]MDH2211217.1 GNAT family N-acetyltransferase [Agrobacterium sp. GD03643]MDH2222884.1 GNAT family N-acetyltransferase [Agrobacterium sp. GD03638]